jgi:hypothetical protein
MSFCWDGFRRKSELVFLKRFGTDIEKKTGGKIKMSLRLDEFFVEVL